MTAGLALSITESAMMTIRFGQVGSIRFSFATSAGAAAGAAFRGGCLAAMPLAISTAASVDDRIIAPNFIPPFRRRDPAPA